MEKPRKLNLIEAYYDDQGTKQKITTHRLFPNANYQTWIYFNSESAEPNNIIFMSISLAEQEDAFAVIPMFNVGNFERDGKIYQRWETPLPNLAKGYFRKDKEISLYFQFLEEESYYFVGIFDDISLAPVDFDEGSYAYDLETEQTYELDDGVWVIAEELKIMNQAFGYDIIKVFVAKGLRVNKESVDIDITKTILSYLAQLQSNVGGVGNIESVEGIYYNNIAEYINAINQAKVSKHGDIMSGSLDMDGNIILNVPEPTSDGEASNKKYVDDEVQGAKDYTDTEVQGAKNYTDTEVQGAKDYTDTEIQELKEDITVGVGVTEEYVDTSISNHNNNPNAHEGKIELMLDALDLEGDY